jgi:hypothetical protein
LHPFNLVKKSKEIPMTPEIKTKINEYLSDETKLYQDWYTGLTQTEEGQYTKEVGVELKLPALKEMYEGWVKQQLPVFKEKLCPPYCKKRQEYQAQETLLIAALADILTFTFTGMPINSVAAAVILVTTKRLDKLCECSKSIEDLTVTELKTIASEAGRKAYDNAKRQGFRVTELREGQIVWVYPDGHTEPVINNR